MAAFKNDRKRFFNDAKSSLDDPPNSRLFIICSKQLTEDDLRDSFSKFGEIEELWIVKDRNTGERKGVAYIKFSKTSEAATALEAMNGKTIGSGTRQIKVMIAANRDQGAKREGNEEQKLLRLFVMVPKTMSNEDLQGIFSVYGDIEYAAIIRDKSTQESKGFAYVKYTKFSHAAAAFEQCDRKYRAVFAEPRKPRQSEQSQEQFYPNNYDLVPPPPHRGIPLPQFPNDGFTGLQVIGSPILNQDQVWKLFNIVPGMDFCQTRLEGNPRPDRSISIVSYNNPRAASYALEKLHGFEYPVGSRLIVKADYNSRGGFNEPRGGDRFNEQGNEPPTSMASRNPDLVHLAETIAQATSIIQAAGYSPAEFISPNKNRFTEQQRRFECNVSLPDPQPILDSNTEMEARCFIVCNQESLPHAILRDAFCRFGNLIDIYLLPNRHCGYAKYATRQSAENAIKTLHGAEVCGVRLKVMEAAEPGERSKRMRFNE